MGQLDRRHFLRQVGCLTAAGAAAGAQALASTGEGRRVGPADPNGVLVDLSLCIGCRMCEHACKQANNLPPESGDIGNQDVFATARRPTPDAHTVINAYTPPGSDTVYAKSNCLHCQHASCVSACIVGALRKQDDGAVTYDAWKCIGCRYCMVACPFQIPTYTYDKAFTPLVRKCELCKERTSAGKLPACVAACPRQTMVYGKRRELLELARERIRKRPEAYVDHVYGEHEVGGTSWLYLSPVPFEQVGFLQLGSESPAALTETIQHGVFKMGLPPLALAGALGAIMYAADPQRRAAPASAAHGGHAAPAPPLPALGAAASAHPDAHAAAADHHGEPRPVRQPFFTPGVLMLLGLMVVGIVAGLYRFIFGIGAATNLDQQYPWGLWIGIDVASGVALAAGGFTSAFLAHVLHRERYHAVVRPALLTAMLGYTFVCIGLQADLGRYYNVWHPMVMWQGNSVLFEVGICVMCYLTVLYLEFLPIVCQQLMTLTRFPAVVRLAAWVQARTDKVMFLLIIAGCCLSCLHQSSLGNLMVIAPTKLHPLWWTPISPLLFLLSAIAVGYPMVIWESLFAGWSLRLKPEMDVLTPLARFVPFTLGFYLAFKLGDMAYRGTYTYLGDGSLQSRCWLLEVGGGVVLPLLLLSVRRVRQSPGWLFACASLVVFGVIFNRVNVFLVGYRPPYATHTYTPAFCEWAVTIGLIACLMLIYRLVVTFLPVISQPKLKATA
jgi:Ni/Fe-hydrogenase subunit HybB-like protein/Fe-S-cluster-containing dehydrogenase component